MSKIPKKEGGRKKILKG